MKKLKQLKNNYKKYYPLMLVAILLAADSAFAAGDNKAAIKAMADSATSMFQGDLIRIAINGGGLAAIIYSIVGGFKPGPFLGGIGLIVFYALFTTYTASFFA
jgi:hypothetical protein